MGICPFSPMYGVKLHTIKSLNFLMTKPRPGIQPKKKKKPGPGETPITSTICTNLFFQIFFMNKMSITNIPFICPLAT